MDASLRLDDPSSAARLARQFTADVLDGWCPGRDRAADAVLVVSEVVTNAVRHSTGPVRLRLRGTGGRLRIEVHDGSPRPPVLLPLERSAERGRGLRIVSRLATRWGSSRQGAGKVVWVDLACEPDRTADRNRAGGNRAGGNRADRNRDDGERDDPNRANGGRTGGWPSALLTWLRRRRAARRGRPAWIGR